MPTPGLTPQQIVDLYKQYVTDHVNSFGTATWHSSNFTTAPAIFTHTVSPKLGDRAESLKTLADLPPQVQLGVTASTIIFNILHGWAMELTRVRKVHAWIIRNSDPIHDGGTQLAALKPEYAAYFPIPGGQPMPGQPISLVQFQNFLTALRNQVNLVRNNTATGSPWEMDVVTCHSNCHSNCHSSRNRR